MAENELDALVLRFQQIECQLAAWMRGRVPDHVTEPLAYGLELILTAARYRLLRGRISLSRKVLRGSNLLCFRRR